MSSCRMVMQARVSSSRLAAKSLLPLRGIPLAALCALRAANQGGEIVVATSTDPSDDILASALSGYTIRVVRGALDDVLGRFVTATADMSASDVVVRLTADNIVPDGAFVDELVRQFRAANVDYLGTRYPADGLPYGVSAEVFTVDILREAADAARSVEEREHVTPWIRAHGRSTHAIGSALLHGRRLDHLRCTLDSLEDYLRIAKLLETMPGDPVKIPWTDLVEAFALAPGAPRFRIPTRPGPGGSAHGVLALGTAQLGMPYGVANRTGEPTDAGATEIVRRAIDYGVTFIDTARAYGDSERRIGAALNPGYVGRAMVSTKLDPLKSLDNGATDTAVIAAVDGSVFRSCRELQARRLDVLMLHRWSHRRQFREGAWRRLLELKAGGVIGALGTSVSSPDEAIDALQDPEIAHLQVPYNILDWRWHADEFLDARRRRPDVSVYVRSVYLQGVLLSDAPIWPAGIVSPERLIARIDRAVAEFARESRADLCIAYVTGAEWVTTTLIGAETGRQLNDNLSLALRPALTPDERIYLQRLIGKAPERLLNPALWGT